MAVAELTIEKLLQGLSPGISDKDQRLIISAVAKHEGQPEISQSVLETMLSAANHVRSYHSPPDYDLLISIAKVVDRYQGKALLAVMDFFNNCAFEDGPLYWDSVFGHGHEVCEVFTGKAVHQAINKYLGHTTSLRFVMNGIAATAYWQGRDETAAERVANAFNQQGVYEVLTERGEEVSTAVIKDLRSTRFWRHPHYLSNSGWQSYVGGDERVIIGVAAKYGGKSALPLRNGIGPVTWGYRDPSCNTTQTICLTNFPGFVVANPPPDNDK